MSCKCDAGRVGTNYEQGVFVAESVLLCIRMFRMVQSM